MDQSPPFVPTIRYSGDTPLHTAARNNQLEEVQRLLEAGADVNSNSKRKSGSPLRAAAMSGSVGIAQLLIDAGADPNARNENGETPVFLSAFLGHAGIVQILLSAGADPNAKHDEGWTPLHLAAKNNHTKVAQLLVAIGADLTDADNFDGQTPAGMADCEGNTDLAEYLRAASIAKIERAELSSTVSPAAIRPKSQSL